MDPKYEPEQKQEVRTIYGVKLEQRVNDAVINREILKDVTTEGKQHVTADVERDILVSLIALKYTQSNSVCLAKDGQVIGIGAGQQSRIHCTRLAADKADNWWLRQHPKVMGMQFKKGTKRAEMSNAIDSFVLGLVGSAVDATAFNSLFEAPPLPLTPEERKSWLSTLEGVSLGSDAFFPFRDSIDRAVRSGVSFVCSPSGSAQDAVIKDACVDHKMTLIHTNIRLFHH